MHSRRPKSLTRGEACAALAGEMRTANQQKHIGRVQNVAEEKQNARLVSMSQGDGTDIGGTSSAKVAGSQGPGRLAKRIVCIESLKGTGPERRNASKPPEDFYGESQHKETIVGAEQQFVLNRGRNRPEATKIVCRDRPRLQLPVPLSSTTNRDLHNHRGTTNHIFEPLHILLSWYCARSK